MPDKKIDPTLESLIKENKEAKDFFEKTKAYCTMPWVHLHVSTNGNVFPCCIADWKQPLGNINIESFDQLWNNEEFRSFRRKMIQDQKDSRCAPCYEKEKAGEWSLRRDSFKYQKTAGPWVLNTEDDGTSLDSKPIYWDIRFSNICNMRCRMCGHFSSSRWFNDAKQLMEEYDDRQYINNEQNTNAIIRGVEDSMGLLDRLEEYLPYVEELYFAGGEPLIMDEHYRILEFLYKHKLWDTRIRYSTNLSKLTYKSSDVVEMWKNFKWVECVTSVDSSGTRAEIIRKDTVWNDIISNAERIKAEAPNVWFRISPTVQILSVYTLPHLHLDWIERGLINPNDCFYNILSSPKQHNIQALPPHMKDEIEDIWNNYWQRLETDYPDMPKHDVKMTLDQTIQFMKDDQLDESYLKMFVEKTRNLDKIRQENTPEAFPELKYIWDNYS